MPTIDERVTDLEHRMLALEQCFDKIKMDTSPMYIYDNISGKWSMIVKEKEND